MKDIICSINNENEEADNDPEEVVDDDPDSDVCC